MQIIDDLKKVKESLSVLTVPELSLKDAEEINAITTFLKHKSDLLLSKANIHDIGGMLKTIDPKSLVGKFYKISKGPDVKIVFITKLLEGGFSLPYYDAIGLYDGSVFKTSVIPIFTLLQEGEEVNGDKFIAKYNDVFTPELLKILSA